jgi:hypothetical protein
MSSVTIKVGQINYPVVILPYSFTILEANNETRVVFQQANNSSFPLIKLNCLVEILYFPPLSEKASFTAYYTELSRFHSTNESTPF